MARTATGRDPAGAVVSRLSRCLLARRVSPRLAPTYHLVHLACAWVGASLVAATAGVHLHLWLSGYRNVPRLGWLFLAQAITGLAAAPVIALARHTILLLGGASYMAASAGGLLLSATVGFVGIHDGLGVPWAAWSLVFELSGLVLLAAAATLVALRH